MRDVELFERALGLMWPWRVERTEFDAEERRLDLHLDFERGGTFACPECGGEECKAHDTRERSWRHLDFFQHQAFLHARVPRVSCPACGVKQVQVPWARPGGGFTVLFEALVMQLAKEMPVKAVGRLIGENDTRVWRMLKHHVGEARQAADYSDVRCVGMDETACRRGHDYITLFADLERSRLMYATEGRAAGVVKAFRKDLESHGGKAGQIGVVYPWRGEFDVDGSLVDWGIDYPGFTGRPGGPAPSRVVYYPVRFSGDFATGDTLPVLEFGFDITPEGEWMIFGEILSWFQDRKGTIWFAHNKTYTLYRRTLEGDTTLQSSMEATPARVGAGEIDSVRAIYIDRGQADRAPGVEAFPETKPMIRRIFADDVGHIFVLSELDGLPLGTFVDVFRESGRYLGRMELPAPVNFPYPPPVATGTHLYYVTTDELDVEYIVRIRLDKPTVSRN